MIVSIRKQNCDETGKMIKKGDLLIANHEGADFDLTAGRIYVAIKNQGDGTFHDCIHVIDDRGVEQDYCSAYFCFYEGELVTEA
ncbi:hypothetical protein CVD28_00760 [Bacillus sp. M6-12]|uniref:hypothetical protein n=1 Tax=Bacillus sp. M6-12 TaxID=2054166 RepID=UPI000C78E3B0|nr:hypothetical protein [Bacillus sp. M6-12]PLS18964.1 hypothetical protein CVD28_00760 [Bacillus sp. M6-12]